MKRFSASVPQHHPVVAHNVLCHQRSSKPPHDIQISSVLTHGKNGKIVHQRNEFDDQNNINPYVDTVVMSLRSHMDVQCTDGYSMLLQYVSLYVTKMHDDFICDDLYKVFERSRFRASAIFAAALHCCSACQPSAVDLQRRHRASVAQAFPQKTPDCNIPVFCPNVARHLQLLVQETFVERRFSCLGRNTN